MDADFKAEQLLYERLLGAYHEFPPVTGHSYTTGNAEHWESLNSVIAGLEKLGHTTYSEFRITPENVHWNDSVTQTVNISSLRMKMMSVLRMLGSEFGLGDPAYDLSRYSTGSSIQMSQHASPYANANSNQHQEQNQTQSVVVSVEQEIEKLQRIIDENLAEDQIEQVRQPLEAFKQNPIVWRNAQKLIQVGVGFSRDVAVQFIGSVLAVLALASHKIS